MLLQVSALKKDMSEARELVQQKEADLQQLRAKLEVSEAELNASESALNQTMKDLNLQQDKLRKVQDEADARVRHLEELVARLQVSNNCDLLSFSPWIKLAANL